MGKFVDLHCHFVPGIDDGCRSIEEAKELLGELAKLGFGTVYATPHMRPGLFDNDAAMLQQAFESSAPLLRELPDCPQLALSAEHYFDDVVYGRILAGAAVPYPGGRAILLEFYESSFPFSIDQRLADLTRRGLTPIIAHPERYQMIAKDPEILERLLDVGARALLDVGALVGKYGRNANKTAEALLERGLYAAACTDSHRPSDVATMGKAINRLVKDYGDEAVQDLLVDGPLSLLNGPR